MNNSTTIDIPTSNSLYWVKFLKQNGKIKSISARNISDFTDDESILETDNPICGELIQNKLNKRMFAVLWDPFENKWKIDKKSDTLIIKPLHNKLEQLDPTRSPDSSDIHVCISKVNGEIKVSANLEQIAKNLHLSRIQHLVNDTEGLIDLYLTKKNDPDYLLQVISINPEELIIKGSTLVKVDKRVLELTDWDNVSIYTKPFFKYYSLEFIETTVTINAEDKSIGQLTKAKSSQNFTRDCEINISILNKEIEILSSLTKQQLYMFKGNKKFNIYVCDREIDNYIATIQLDAADLCMKKSIKFDKPIAWPNKPLLTYKNPKLRINHYIGEHND